MGNNTDESVVLRHASSTDHYTFKTESTERLSKSNMAALFDIKSNDVCNISSSKVNFSTHVNHWLIADWGKLLLNLDTGQAL